MYSKNSHTKFYFDETKNLMICARLTPVHSHFSARKLKDEGASDILIVWSVSYFFQVFFKVDFYHHSFGVNAFNADFFEEMSCADSCQFPNDVYPYDNNRKLQDVTIFQE